MAYISILFVLIALLISLFTLPGCKSETNQVMEAPETPVNTVTPAENEESDVAPMHLRSNTAQPPGPDFNDGRTPHDLPDTSENLNHDTVDTSGEPSGFNRRQ